MIAEPITPTRFDFDAGHVALAFANSLDARYDDPPRDLLTDYDALLVFAQESESLSEREAAALRAAAQRDPVAAANAHAAAVALREDIFRLFSTLAADGAPDADALAALNGHLARMLPRGGVGWDGESFAWTWEVGGSSQTDLERPLWPIAWAAMDLLLHGPVERVRECAADDCGWLFVDTTRNRARRWCSMKSCGNRAKVQHFRERQRGA